MKHLQLLAILGVVTTGATVVGLIVYAGAILCIG